MAEAWKWWDKGQLQVFRPQPSKILVDALPIYDAELNASEAWETTKRREEAEAKAKAERE